MSTDREEAERQIREKIEKDCGIRAADNLGHYLASVGNLFEFAVRGQLALLSLQKQNASLNSKLSAALRLAEEMRDGKGLKEICYQYLSEAFHDGTKVDRFDAEISEYWLPHIDYDVVPRMVKALSDFLGSSNSTN